MVTATEPTSHGPRKVIVGTTIFSVFPDARPFTTLERRLDEIGERLAEMAAESQRAHGRGLDIAVFPENSLNNRAEGPLKDRSVILNEELDQKLGAMARKHGTWLALSFNLLENPEEELVYNVAVLYDRQGRRAGIYRKVYCLPDPDGHTVEGGKQPGTEYPVFETDFGKVAMLICYDMGFDELMEAYAAQGAELLLWPSMSPQTMLPRLYARRFGFHIVSATPRSNASVFDPLGDIIAQTTKEGVVTAEIDLNYEIVHWQTGLDGGKPLKAKYGEQVDFRYHVAEDYGIFWSNDPATPIQQMLKETGIRPDSEVRDLARQARDYVLEQAP